ncbi:MAG: CRISPR system precrRNA processing endoribonuclease RAMP protein Cas6, partial [Thermoplasmata archaeon]
ITRILMSPYFQLNLEITQKSPCQLPYYGPMVRGWMGDAFYHDKKLMERIFKNPDVDVRPYFHYTISNGNVHIVNLSFIGDAKRYARKIVEALAEKHTSHIGGVPAVIKLIKYEERYFEPLAPSQEIKIRFVSPTSLVEDGKILFHPPSLGLILKAILRSVNRCCKYYFKSAYPVHIEDIETLKGNLVKFEISPFFWTHKTMHGRNLKMSGLTGTFTYRMSEKPPEEIMKILSLTQVFQIGKWVSYGFGKLEVST